MDNQDKIFDQIKTAAQKAETKDFPSMEKVWSRVEEKIDTQVLKTESQLWKKIAVAASVLLIVSLGYQFLKSDKETITPQNEVVVTDSTTSIIPEPILEKNSIVITNPILKKDADKILNRQISTSEKIAVSDIKTDASTSPSAPVIMNEISNNQPNVGRKAKTASPKYVFKGRVFDAIGVHHNNEAFGENKKNETPAAAQKQPPLMVIDGKAITNKSDDTDKSPSQKATELDPDEVESIVVLKEPLYIINGVHYSEEELFGANPTSPYAPLDKQEIESISILQDQSATSIYGEKGKKGVVIITTKTRKPAAKKSN